MGWRTRVWYPAETDIFSLHYHVYTGSGAHPASYQMGPGGSFCNKPSRHEAKCSPPSSATVKNTSYIATPPYIFMVWCLVKLRDNLTFTLPSPSFAWGSPNYFICILWRIDSISAGFLCSSLPSSNLGWHQKG